MEGASVKLLFVLNPIAGGKAKGGIKEQITAYFLDKPFKLFFFESSGINDGEKLRAKISEYKPNALIAAGGDGTVHLCANLVVNSNMMLGLIPLGSANGFAKDVGIPENIGEALKIISAMHTKPIDVLKLNDHYCFHQSDFGFNARVCFRFAGTRIRGKITYAWSSLKEFVKYKPFNYEIDVKGEVYHGKAFMLTLTNFNMLGAFVDINPLGDMDDGSFEIAVLRPFPLYEIPKIIYQLLNSEIHKSEYYFMIPVKRAVIKNPDKEFFQIDGEPVNIGEKVTASILKKGLLILMPKP